MIVKTIHEIANMMHASVHGDIDDTKKIHGVVIDSRQVTRMFYMYQLLVKELMDTLLLNKQ